MRSGHAPGHIRISFLDAICAFHDWSMSDGDQPPRTVTREIKWEPHQISLAEACGLVWNCTDVLPGSAFDMIADEDIGLPIRRRTMPPRRARCSAPSKKLGWPENSVPD
jgi:hypothetical protein